MAAEIITIDPAHPEIAFSRCREVLGSGGVIAYPTETFYGLGADPKNAAAVRKLFDIKGRQADQPLLLLIQDLSQVAEWAAVITPAAKKFMKQYWPGPLTLVFAARPEVLPELTAGTGKIGLRVPGSELTRRLLRDLGIALTGTSANRSGMKSPQTAEEAAAEIGDGADLILDGGRTPGGMPSTVVDVSEEPPHVIRKGTLAVMI
ncbi:MAG: L-threonylcarbamoyladenylate synthase [Nitrospirota bacterium]